MKIIFIVPLMWVNTLTRSPKVEVIKLPDMLEILNEKSEEVKIINFWATWCKPCIEELPQFEQANKDFKNVEIVLVSLDDVEGLHDKVIPFIQSRGLQSQIKLLDETDYNLVINNIHKEWSGAIPATLIIDKQGKRHLYEKEFKDGELHKLITSFINK